MTRHPSEADHADARVSPAGWMAALAMCALGSAGYLFVNASAGPVVGVTPESVAAALPALLVYLALPRLVDRYAPEPAWVLLLCALMGAVGAAGLAVAVNAATMAAMIEGGFSHAEAWSRVTQYVAPPVEECAKALPLLWLLYFARHEFDGVADAVLAAIFVGLGFAFAENLALSAWSGHLSGAEPSAARTWLTPWAHPLFTAMTGVGLGLWRERLGRIRVLAPIVGLASACAMHVVWNQLHTHFALSTWPSLALWAACVGGLASLSYALVRRKGRIVSAYLQDEVLYGSITEEELLLVGARFGRLVARIKFGAPGARFVDAAAKLALCKWHTTCARHARQGTFSAHLIAPLRAELGVQRAAIGARLGREMPAPSRWVPTPKSMETPTRYN